MFGSGKAFENIEIKVDKVVPSAISDAIQLERFGGFYSLSIGPISVAEWQTINDSIGVRLLISDTVKKQDDQFFFEIVPGE